jgi:hypothetical protein
VLWLEIKSRTIEVEEDIYSREISCSLAFVWYSKPDEKGVDAGYCFMRFFLLHRSRGIDIRNRNVIKKKKNHILYSTATAASTNTANGCAALLCLSASLERHSIKNLELKTKEYTIYNETHC